MGKEKILNKSEHDKESKMSISSFDVNNNLFCVFLTEWMIKFWEKEKGLKHHEQDCWDTSGIPGISCECTKFRK